MTRCSQYSTAGWGVQPSHLIPTSTATNLSLTFLQTQHRRCFDLHLFSKRSPNPCQNSNSSLGGTYHPRIHFLGWSHPRCCSSWTCQHRSSSPHCCCVIRGRGHCSSRMDPCWSGSIVPAGWRSMLASHSMYHHYSRCVPQLHWVPSWKPFPEKQSDQGKSDMYSNEVGDSIWTQFELSRSSITGLRGFECRPEFAAGTRHQERRTRSDLRLEGKALVSVAWGCGWRVKELAT